MSKPNSPPAPVAAESHAPLDGGRPPQDVVPLRADALFRAANECCRQHRRYAALVQRPAGPAERRRTVALVRLTNDHLLEAASLYEKATANGAALRAEDWFRAANALWLASREYARRREVARRSAEQLEQNDANAMGEIALDYDLEASALLGISHAVDSYRKVRPDAELCPPVVKQS